MTKWELAKYLIDAKKNIDSIWYIAENYKALCYLPLQNKIRMTENDFYLNCAIVLDNACKGQKKELCAEYPEIEAIYYERDKNIAHKDSAYDKTKFNTYENLILTLKQRIVKVRQVCQHALPDKLTLDFIPFDGELFRILHGVTPTREQEIIATKHLLPQNTMHILPPKHKAHIFKNIEEAMQYTPSEKDKVVLIKNGINCEEGLQYRQEGVLKVNIWFGTDIWVTFSEDEWRKQQYYRKIGLFDQFDTLLFPEDEREQKVFIQKLKDEGLIDE